MLKKIARKAATSLGVEITRVRDELRMELYSAEDRAAKCFYNVGAGSFRHPCWTNLDFSSEHYAGVQRNFLPCDLMSGAPLPIRASAAKVIYTSHTIEHVKDDAVARLFREAHRALMPGGVLRVTTGPDADTDYAALMRGDKDWFYWTEWHSRPGTWEHMLSAPANSAPLEERWLHHVASACAPISLTPGTKFTAPEIRAILSSRPMAEALDYFTSLCEYRPDFPGDHVSWWNAEKIMRFMREAGFVNVSRSGCMQSASPYLRQSKLFDYTHPQISVYVEAIR